jgi:hypothetical protein
MYETKVILNDNDPDLVPIPVDILDLIQRVYKRYGKTPPTDYPSPELIANYGLKREEQYFRYAAYPQRLTQLEEGLKEQVKKDMKTSSPMKRDQEVVERFWETLSERQDEYEQEIKWIEKQWYHRLFGYWFFCNGKAIWMPGKHYYFLNYYEINNVGKPQYRNRDRKWWIAMLYARTETRTFVNLDKNGYAIPNVDGSYDLIDTGRRVFYGGISAKPRRVGDTSKSACNLLEEATRHAEVHLGIQGADEKGGENVFVNHITLPFKKQPIIFKPQFARLNLKEPLRFDTIETDRPLNTMIDYAESKFGSAYDGRTLWEYYGDEVGKVEEESIKMRHKVIRLCTSERDIIRGSITYTTTVEDMSKAGSHDFFELCKDSMWNRRLPNGQTLSGMLTLFFRASDGHPEFLDKFGYSVEEMPTEEQAAFIKKNYGAIEYLEGQRRLLKEEDLAKEKRQNPLKFREIFTPPAQNIFFPVRRIEDRVSEIMFAKSKFYRRGNFQWIDSYGSNVQFVDADNGRFLLSRMFTPEETNRVVMRDGTFYPEYPDKFISSADPFRLEKTTGSRMSDGGFATFWNRDYLLDPDGKNVTDFISYRFIITYRHRPPTTEEYCEDVLKACIYTGSMLFPENDVDLLTNYFIDNNYEGFLLYQTDKHTGQKKPNPGFNSRLVAKQKIFSLLKDYMEMHVERERHPDLLNEILEIPNIEKMTDYDLFTAAGGCLLALESQQVEQMIERQKFDNPIDDFYWERTY